MIENHGGKRSRPLGYVKSSVERKAATWKRDHFSAWKSESQQPTTNKKVGRVMPGILLQAAVVAEGLAKLDNSG